MLHILSLTTNIILKTSRTSTNINILRHHDSDCPPPVLESMENLSSHAGYVRGWVRVMLNDGAIANVLNMLCDGESAELLHFY